jgi:hypothetical protein
VCLVGLKLDDDAKEEEEEEEEPDDQDEEGPGRGATEVGLHRSIDKMDIHYIYD